MGLLEEDTNCANTLEEAAISDSPYKLLELFSVMLVFCQSDPLRLEENHRESLSEDIKKQVENEFGELVIEHCSPQEGCRLAASTMRGLASLAVPS